MKEKFKLIKVEKEDKLLNIIKENIEGISNNDIKKFIKYKQIEIDEKSVSNHNIVVSEGKEIKIYFTKKIISQNGLNILYEDDDLIVIDKPSGLLSISNGKENEKTAYRMVSEYIKQNRKNAKLFVVHRLDQDTSGVLLFSKNLRLKDKLQNNWNSLVTLREYVAVVEGKIEKPGTIKSYLTENNFKKVYSTKNQKIGKLAITNYEPLKCKNGKTLLKINIETGKKNQIRVHLSESGHPIIGDTKYGSKNNSINRLALHASKLELKDPRSGEHLVFESSIPKNIQALLK